ncbi:MAG: DUF484 family protein [Alphaproteobacteria bacterium]|nr:DUF484 family protein [Alphaproteobacteria bacterium]
MSSSSERSNQTLIDMMPQDVRAYLLSHPDFFEENADILEEIIPPQLRLGDGVPDFQKYMLARLQDDFLALKGEHEDLMELMQENLLRQNRINVAVTSLLDAHDFNETIRIIGHEFASMLEHEAIGFFLEAGGWLDTGDYDGLKVVAPGIVGRWLNGRDLALEEVSVGQEDIYGDKFQHVHSQALIRIVIREGLPPGMLALGHGDPTYYATGLATEQLECLGGVVERCLRKWLL